MKYDLKRPCPKCPFRTDVKPFLTKSRAREIARTMINQQGTFACHETTVPSKYDDGERVETNSTRHCAGAMIMLEKMGIPNQMMRICERLGMYDPTKLDMAAPVFDTDRDFIKAQRRV